LEKSLSVQPLQSSNLSHLILGQQKTLTLSSGFFYLLAEAYSINLQVFPEVDELKICSSFNS
jgi:hypothetical protein